MWLCKPGQARPGQPGPCQADVCTLFVGLIARSDVGRACKNLLEAGVIALLDLLVLLYLLSFLLAWLQLTSQPH